MPKTDRRIRKSQEAIKKALIELMAEREFDQITLQDISDKADVSRRTIYLHYMDKFDLLDKLIEEHISNIREICERTDDDTGYSEMGLVWFEYFRQHTLFFSALLGSKGSPFFRQRFLEFFLGELEKDNSISGNGKAEQPEDRNVDIQFLGSAIVGVVEWWFRNGQPLPPDVMSQRVGALLERNLGSL